MCPETDTRQAGALGLFVCGKGRRGRGKYTCLQPGGSLSTSSLSVQGRTESGRRQLYFPNALHFSNQPTPSLIALRKTASRFHRQKSFAPRRSPQGIRGL